MELLFNELSVIPESPNCAIANERVSQFVTAFSQARNRGVDGIRFLFYLPDIILAKGYSMQDWLSSPASKEKKDLLLGAFRYPFIDDSKEKEKEEYILYDYFFEDIENGISRTKCHGLAAAHIYPTLSISFTNSPAWQRNTLHIQRVNDDATDGEKLEVGNIFSPDCFTTDIIKQHLEQNSPPELIRSEISPLDKPIKLNDDHGKDVLDDFAERLIKSPYVTAVLNSLRYNPKCPRFILRVLSNGVIHLVLHWDDRGLGMAIQTTGRTFRETEEIAKILQSEYDS